MSDHKTKLNEKKCYLLPVKCEERPKLTLNQKEIQYKSEQKDLGIVMSTKINWKPNIETRCSKAFRAFYFLKRNTAKSTKISAKLNAYVGYEWWHMPHRRGLQIKQN